ncbi:MAG: hypothetical protein PHI90_01420 [Clostridia bacterium]|nr:hypothetical protein [Clostridia bacterium]
MKRVWEFSAQKGVSILESVNNMSNEIKNTKEMCIYLRNLLENGTYKLDALLNIIGGIKSKEQEILASGGDQSFVEQINEEQIDSFLEMLKSPAFQKIARQMLTKFIMQSNKK